MPRRDLPVKFQVAFSFAGEQRDLVSAIAEAVEQELGHATVFFDEWFEYFLAGQDADLKLQKIYGEQSELVVVCVSERYGGKPWTLAEHEAIRARVMQARSSTEERDQLRVLPIRVGDGDVKGILFNTIVPEVRGKSAAESADLILSRLRLILRNPNAEDTGQPSHPSWPDTPPLEWPMADHSGARDAFERLLTHNAPWRLLSIRGSSETGKSHITRQMLGNALRVRDLACGRFDFKGTTDMDGELRAFVQYLGVPVPPASPRFNERLANVLDTLKRRSQPALLIFDTYNAAGEAQDWVEKQLLPSLIRATWLRVVIAGQSVPSTAGAVWASVVSPTLELVPPPPEDWLAFGQRHKPGITLDFVRQAHQYCGGKSSVMAQLVGPAA
jgi:hypothetical protein